jgi:hypothetical protein
MLAMEGEGVIEDVPDVIARAEAEETRVAELMSRPSIVLAIGTLREAGVTVEQYEAVWGRPGRHCANCGEWCDHTSPECGR